MKEHRFRTALLPLALLAMGQPVVAQQPPTGGSQLQQIPAAPQPQRAPPEIRIEQRATPPEGPSASTKIVVNALRITGAAIYPEAELVALAGFTPGREFTLAELQEMARRIAAHYRSNGFFAAQAVVPAQDIRDNTVTIAVSEGRYGQVTLRNQTSLRDGLARSQLHGLGSGDVIATAPLENRLLLLGDIPGIRVSSTLAPGTAEGTSDLVVDLKPAPRISGSFDADNAGNRYTGAHRVGATVNLDNPLGLGDRASLRLLTSGPGLKYGRISYQVQAGRGQVGVAYSRLDYELGREFEPLLASGTAQVASVYGRYPLVRSRASNLYVLLGLDAKAFHDRVDSVPSFTDRKSRVLFASLYGDNQDSFGGGGANSYYVSLAAGSLDIDTPAAQAADALTARTNGHFSRLSFQAARVQRLAGPFSVLAAIRGQLASKNLDVSEKMELGGMQGVRAYPEGEAYADEGYIVTLEARMDLPKPTAVPGHVQLVAFIDGGSVTINKKPWAPGDNRRTLSGAGVGAEWADAGNFMVRAYYARRLGNEAATSAPDKPGRFWVQLVKYF
ncbi:MAG: ShlB/FhaC/HecB family hemolysin secretion/activation protein [Burkholderiales bacterium]|nr:ShlB/FhaC/HecB family hemolysin secretion/activation protein [Burkholderiales bacterium]